MLIKLFILIISPLITLLFFVYGYNAYYLMSALRSYRSPRLRSGRRPAVAIHLPVYNERYVVARLIRACGRMAEEYGLGLVRIVVIDDSDDDTRPEIDRLAGEQRARGIRVEVLRREVREGFKAGALQAALERTPEEFVAIFDADFEPPPDFLIRAMPALAQDPGLAVVQARWEHINRDYSIFTRTISLGIDVHFYIEQPARCAAGCFLNFNGSGGVIRAAAIRAAGGWQCDTLAEDLDLSYRIQMQGYRILYLRDLACPGEVPPSLSSWKKQQARWACGSLRTAKKLLPALLADARLGLKERLQGFIHLTGYLVHPLMLCSFLLACAAAFFHVSSGLAGIALSGPAGALFAPGGVPFLILAVAIVLCTVAVWLYPLVAIKARGGAIFGNLSTIMLLGLLGFGISMSNSIEVAKALFSARAWPFRRTPKYAVLRTGDQWRTKRYQVPLDASGLLEAGLAGLGAAAIFAAERHASFGLIPILAVYTAAYALVFCVTLAQNRRREA